MVTLSAMATPEQRSPLVFQSLGARIFQAAKMEFKASAVVYCKTTVSLFKQNKLLLIISECSKTEQRPSSGWVVAPICFWARTRWIHKSNQTVRNIDAGIVVDRVGLCSLAFFLFTPESFFFFYTKLVIHINKREPQKILWPIQWLDTKKDTKECKLKLEMRRSSQGFLYSRFISFHGVEEFKNFWIVTDIVSLNIILIIIFISVLCLDL